MVLILVKKYVFNRTTPETCRFRTAILIIMLSHTDKLTRGLLHLEITSYLYEKSEANILKKSPRIEMILVHKL